MSPGLTDGAWLGCIVVGAFWLILAIYVYAQSSSDIYDNDYDMYDYKDDVPMAVPTPPMQTKTNTAAAQEYHASSPHNANVDYGYYNQPAGGYQEYDSYYDYPPQSAYAGYKQPVAADPYGYGGGGGGYMAAGRPEDTVHMMSDMSTDPNHQAYYSPHLATTQAPATPITTTAHTTAQSPNAY